MIKFIVFRVIRWRLNSALLPKLSSSLSKKIFTYSYKFFTLLKPSQIWVIVLALINKTDIKKLLGLPSIFVLFSSILSDSPSSDTPLNSDTLYTKMVSNNLLDKDNKWENFFFIIIGLALIKKIY